jgi:hypothetical protein
LCGPSFEGVEVELSPEVGADEFGCRPGTAGGEDLRCIPRRDLRVGQRSLGVERAEEVPSDDDRPEVSVVKGRIAGQVPERCLKVVLRTYRTWVVVVVRGPNGGR